MVDSSQILNTQLRNQMKSREYTTEVCDKPTRKGHYLKFSAKGLSPGYVWFVGKDENGRHIEEYLGV